MENVRETYTIYKNRYGDDCIPGYGPIDWNFKGMEGIGIIDFHGWNVNRIVYNGNIYYSEGLFDGMVEDYEELYPEDEALDEFDDYLRDLVYEFKEFLDELAEGDYSCCEGHYKFS